MRQLLLVLLALPSLAWAAPFVTCDTDPRTTHTALQLCTSVNTSTTPASCTTWGVWGPDVPSVVISPTQERCANHDISTVPIGVNIARAKAIDVASVWTGGREESPPSDPFVFTRPAALAAPVILRLVP